MRAPLRETLRFVLGQTGPAPAKILEVGAGDGELAAALNESGHTVTALDRSHESVEEARRRGVRAVQAEWPGFDECCFDRVLFTRSLHHIPDLDGAVSRAREVLSPGGRILVEDFAFLDAGDATILWFADLVKRLESERGGVGWERTWAARIAASDHPLDVWFEDPHHLHPFSEMRSALDGVGRVAFEETAPYLYRYVAETGYPELDGILAAERDAAARGEIQLIGRRVAVHV